MYKFRITFSTDVNEHYKFDGYDTTVSMVVVAETWSRAETMATTRLEQLLQGAADGFELVSVQNLTVMALEEERKNGEA